MSGENVVVGLRARSAEQAVRDEVHLSTLSGRGTDQHPMRWKDLVSLLGDEG